MRPLDGGITVVSSMSIEVLRGAFMLPQEVGFWVSVQMGSATLCIGMAQGCTGTGR